MRRVPTAELILIKFGISTAWADVYLKRHPNWSKGWGGCEVSPIPLTLPLAFSTAYYTTTHVRDIKMQFWIEKCATVKLLQSIAKNTEGMVLPNAQVIQDVKHDGYKYLRCWR